MGLVSFIGVFTHFAHNESVRLANEHLPPAVTNWILCGITSKRAFFVFCQTFKTCICKYVTISTEVICHYCYNVCCGGGSSSSSSSSSRWWWW